MALGTNAMRRQGGVSAREGWGKRPRHRFGCVFLGWGDDGVRNFKKGLKDEICPHLEVDGWFFLEQLHVFWCFFVEKRPVYQRCTVFGIWICLVCQFWGFEWRGTWVLTKPHVSFCGKDLTRYTFATPSVWCILDGRPTAHAVHGCYVCAVENMCIWWYTIYILIHTYMWYANVIVYRCRCCFAVLGVQQQYTLAKFCFQVWPSYCSKGFLSCYNKWRMFFLSNFFPRFLFHTKKFQKSNIKGGWFRRSWYGGEGEVFIGRGQDALTPCPT